MFWPKTFHRVALEIETKTEARTTRNRKAKSMNNKFNELKNVDDELVAKALPRAPGAVNAALPRQRPPAAFTEINFFEPTTDETLWNMDW